MSISHKPYKWNILNQELQADCRIFQVYKRQCQHPVDKRSGDFFSIHSNDFVLVLALTHDNHLVLAEQYRFGADEVHLEIPGGVVDKNEDHKAAAARELLEETGYAGDTPLVIGTSRPNPAILDNNAYFILIQNCKKVADVNWDPHEEIRVSTLPLQEVFHQVKTGTIHHGITLNALLFLKLYLENTGNSS